MVVKRPTGHKIIDQNISASIIEDYVGDAIVQFPYHGLGTGDTVYIESDIDEYNGFWYVTAVDANQFKISEHSEADFVEHYQDADIDYYQTQEHDWSSIFLPIVYKVSNNLWPTNNQEPIRNVSSYSDDNGFVSLVLSGSLKGSFNALEFVTLTGHGVFQIVEVISPSEITINLAYETGLSFTTAQYYYNNYQTRVKIYAGLPASHPWEPKKPFTEVAELSLTPDENNEVMFSVSDYITQKVAIKNNTLLFSLPLNLDAFTGFYISTGESFDQSDNYSLYTSEPSFTDDDFQGYAIAGKLPFKNMYSGDYADYVYTSGSPARWLTILDRLLAVDGLYFDVSFIKNVVGTFNLIIDKYITSDYSIPEIILFEDQGIGVYRLPLTIDANYESYCIRVETNAHEEEVEVTTETDFDLSLWLNDNQGLTDWNIGIPNPFVNLLGGNSELLYFPYATAAGQVYTYLYEFTVANSDPGTKTAQLLFLDAAFLASGFSFINPPGDGTYSGSVSITAVSNGTYIAFKGSSIGLAWDITLIEVSVISTVTETIEVPGATITEEICIDIIDSCQTAEQFVADNIRELEDGNYRLLE